MNRRTALALAAGGAATLGFALTLGPAADRPPEGAGTLVFPGIAEKIARAARVEITGAGKAATLVRSLDAWGVAERDMYPAQLPKLRELLVGLTELRRVAPRTADAAAYARLGVEDPAAPAGPSSGATGTATLLRVLDDKGTILAALITGHRRTRTQADVPEQVYIRAPNEPQSWLAEGRLPVDADPLAWLVRDVLDIPRARVARVHIDRAGETLAFGQQDGGFRLLTPADQKTEDFRVESVAGALETLTLSDVRKAPPPGDRLGTARFTTTDNADITLALNRDGARLWATIDGEPARRGWAFEIPEWKEKTLLPKLADLLAEQPKPDAPK